MVAPLPPQPEGLARVSLERSPVLAALGPATLERLARSARPVELERGQILFTQGAAGDAVFVVERGRLRLFRVSPGGRERTLGYLGPGEILGEMAVLGGLPRSASAEAAEPSRVWRLEGRALVDAVASDGRAALRLVELLVRRLAEADRQLEESTGRVEEQLGGLLQRLAREAGSPQIRVTQQELAALLGVTRESVNRALARLEAQGAVRRVGRGVLRVEARPEG